MNHICFSELQFICPTTAHLIVEVFDLFKAEERVDPFPEL
jgi:hypothetical protein